MAAPNYLSIVLHLGGKQNSEVNDSSFNEIGEWAKVAVALIDPHSQSRCPSLWAPGDCSNDTQGKKLWCKVGWDNETLSQMLFRTRT